MKPIFTYLNYRTYLRDYYEEQKRISRKFSYRYFALRANIKAASLLREVISGSRNLTDQMALKFSKGIKFTPKEERYFCNLVKFNQAKTEREKQEYYAILLSFNKSVVENPIHKDQYEYFSNWYHSAIRELVADKPEDISPEYIAENLIPGIKKSEAKKSIDLLFRLKMIKVDDGGIIRQSETHITSGTTEENEMMTLKRREFNGEMIELAALANKKISPSERNVSGLTLGVSPEAYDSLIAELAQFKERVLNIVSNDSEKGRAYQLNFQLFPLSKKEDEKRRKGDENV